MRGNYSPRVAVLIPVFNGRDFLQETLESVHRQDYSDIRVFACNDGSTDDSNVILENFLEIFDGRMSLINHTANQGITKSLLDLCVEAKQYADIAVVIGQDDIIPEGYVKQIIRNFTKDSKLVVTTRAIAIDGTGKRLKLSYSPPWINFLGIYKTALLLASNHINAPGVAFGLNTFHPSDLGQDNSLTQDWQQWIFSSIKADFKVSVKTNVFYRRHDKSLSWNPDITKVHLEISKSRLDFIESDAFIKSITTWGKLRKLTFFIITNLLFSEFSPCRHTKEFMNRLSLILFGKIRQTKKFVRYASCITVQEVAHKKNHEIEDSNLNELKVSSKPLTVDPQIINFIFTFAATVRLFFGRIFHISLSQMKQLVLRKRPITISSTGGIGAQLSGLSYAIWLKTQMKRSVKIIFYEKGLTFYPILIEDLLPDFFYRIIRLQEIPDVSREVVDDRRTRKIILIVERIKGILKSCTKKFLLLSRLVISEEHLSKNAMLRVHCHTKIIKGYHSDWAIINDTWEELATIIDHSRSFSFMRGAGRESSVSIHWRLGDYLNNSQANFTHGTISKEALIELLLKIREEVEFSRVQIFTDSPDTAKLLLEEQTTEFGFQYISGEIWEDLYRMSRSRVFIGSHSSISGWAAISIARSNQESIVYLPDKWFKNEPEGFKKQGNEFLKPQDLFTKIRSYDGRIA